jgi:phage major head subunit gpT-like protein
MATIRESGRTPGASTHGLVRTWREDDGSTRRELAITGQTNLDAANTDYVAEFQDVFVDTTPSPFVSTLLRTVDTGTLNYSVPVALGFPLPRQWVGEKYRRGIRGYSYTLPIVGYEATIELPRRQVDGDNSGAVSETLSGFLGAESDFKEYLATQLFLNNSVNGYDGVPLLSASHPNTNSTGNNLTTSALSWATYNTAKKSMRLFTDENGRPFVRRFKWVLVVGPAQERVALEVTGAQRVVPYSATTQDASSSIVAVTAIENVYQGDALVIVTPYFTGNQWMLANMAYKSRPFINPVFRPLEPQIQVNMDSDARWTRDVYGYSIESDEAYGPGPWPLVYGSVTA